jgi:hypothetical protein
MKARRQGVPPAPPDLPQKQTGGAEGKSETAALPELLDLPGITPGSVDITGIAPEGVRVDPDITEGHPGYEESGDSEIIPPKD